MTAPTRDGDFPALISEIHFGVTTVNDTVTGIIHHAQSALRMLPPTIPSDPTLIGLAELQRASNEVLAGIADVLNQAGDPGHLRATGATWANDIGATTSRLAGFATLNGVRVDDHWTGTAADAYRNTLIPQTNALTAIKTTGDELDATLNDLANGIRDFWSAVSSALIALGVALLAAAATAATMITAPVGAGIGIAALVACGNAVNDARDAFVQVTNDTSSRAAEIQRRLTNDTAFPSGAWPRAVTPISSDGSITDGDDTDWHLR